MTAPNETAAPVGAATAPPIVVCPACKNTDHQIRKVFQAAVVASGRFVVDPGTAFEWSTRARWVGTGVLQVDQQSLRFTQYECDCGVLFNRPSVCVRREDGTLEEIVAGREETRTNSLARRDNEDD